MARVAPILIPILKNLEIALKNFEIFPPDPSPLMKLNTGFIKSNALLKVEAAERKAFPIALKKFLTGSKILRIDFTILNDYEEQEDYKTCSKITKLINKL